MPRSPYNLFFCAILLFCCSCDRIIGSLAKETADKRHEKDSLEFVFNEKPISVDTFRIVARKKIGPDSAFLVRSYFLSGQPYYDSWQQQKLAHGLTTFFFPSGKIQYTMEYRYGRCYTLVNSYDKEGSAIDGGNIKLGNGTLKIYHPITGVLISNSTYVNALKHGKQFTFFSDGNRKEELTFKNDTLVGEYRTYYHSGKVMTVGHLDMTVSTGIIESYYENGKLKKRDLWKNGLQSSYKEYDENGFLISEQERVNGQLIGTKFYYDYKGNLLSKEQECDHKKHGKFEYFYANGHKKSLEMYRNDTLLSETTWHSNGNLSSESIYKDHLKTGIYKEYYPTGHIRSEQTFVKGVEEGSYKSYFNNGNIYNDGMFKQGKLTGDLKFYSENGQLKGVKNISNYVYRNYRNTGYSERDTNRRNKCTFYI